MAALAASTLVDSPQHPDLEHTVSTEGSDMSTRSRKERVQSRLVLVALILLAIVSIISTLVAWFIVSRKDTGRTRIISVAQIFDLIAVSYLVCHSAKHANFSSRHFRYFTSCYIALLLAVTPLYRQMRRQCQNYIKDV